MRAKLADGHNDAGLFRKSRPNPGCSTSSSFRGDRGFESISLQRRVRSEPRPATMSRPQRRHPTLAASMGRVEAERGPTARAEGDPDAGGIATGLVVVGDLDQGDENVRAHPNLRPGLGDAAGIRDRRAVVQNCVGKPENSLPSSVIMLRVTRSVRAVYGLRGIISRLCATIKVNEVRATPIF